MFPLLAFALSGLGRLVINSFSWDTPGTWRVGGILAVSRAFGDKQLKPYVIAEPEIQVLRLFVCVLTFGFPFFPG